MAADARGRRDLYYVYALADLASGRRFSIGRQTLHTIDIDGVSAIVARRDTAPATTAEALQEQHAIVTALASRVEALLPVRFGTRCTRSELETRVKAAHDVISAALNRVRGRAQMTVRVYSASVRLPKPSRGLSGTAYLEARREHDRALRRQAAKITRVVARWVVDERVEPAKGKRQATIYHLINAADVEAYRTAIDAFARSVAPDTIVVTGPWPAFAFVPELPA